MKGNRKKLAFSGIFFGLINKFIHLLVPFLIFVKIKNNLGAEYLGLNNLFSSLLQIFSLAELGFGSALVYEMYKPIANNDKNRVSSLLKFYKKTYQYLAITIFVIGLLCLPFIQHLINGTVPENINIYILFAIYLFNTVVSYILFAYKKSLLQAYQRNDIINKINSIVNIIVYVSQFLILVLFKNYYLYIITLPISTIIDNFIIHLYTKKNYPDIKPVGDLSSEEKKSITDRVKALAGHKIGGIVITSFDSIVISSFLGLTQLALYSNYFYIVKSLTGVLNIGYTSVLAGIGNSLITEDKEYNFKLFNKLSICIFWIVGLLSVCLINLFQPFMIVWMGKEFLLSFSSVALFAIYFYVWQVRIIGLAFKDAAGMWKNDFWKPYIGLVTNLILNVVLVHYFGINGVLLATIFVMIFIYLPWETFVIFKDIFNKSSKKYYTLLMLHSIITVLLACLLLYVLSFVNVSGLLGVVIKGIISVVVVNIVYFLVYIKNEDFLSLLKDVKRLFRK